MTRKDKVQYVCGQHNIRQINNELFILTPSDVCVTSSSAKSLSIEAYIQSTLVCMIVIWGACGTIANPFSLLR